MTEVHSMLNRMVELADQSANGTYDNAVDRANLQKEIASLKDEIDRIADSTNFNGINLLDGSLSTTKLDFGAVAVGGANSATVNPATGTTSAFTVGIGANGTKETLTVEYADENGTLHKVEVGYTSANTAANNDAAILKALQGSELASVFDIKSDGAGAFTLTSKVTGENGAKLTGISTSDKTPTAFKAGAVTAGKNETVTLTGGANTIADGNNFVLNGKTYEFVKDASTKPKTEGATAILVGKTDAETIANLNKALEDAGIKATVANTNDLVFETTKSGKGLTLQNW